jgi:hypothetical protein
MSLPLSKLLLYHAANLRKKVVKAKRFWKINAIRPKIKAKRGRTRKFNLGAESKLGRIGEGVRFLIRNPIYVLGAE